MKFIKSLWAWLGEEKNHNASMVLITFVALILALPYFSKQINTIQIKVDSIESNLQNLYHHYYRETFNYTQIKNDIRPAPDGAYLSLHLKTNPIPNSVNVWWGEMYLSPNDYSVAGDVVTIHFVPQTPEVIADPSNSTPFVVSYVENSQ